MKRLSVPDVAIPKLQDEIRRSRDSRYDHRLHGVLLVAKGMTCPAVAELLGESPRTVENWVRDFTQKGLAGLLEFKRSGHPSRLNQKQIESVRIVLEGSTRTQEPRKDHWNGKTLSIWIKREFGIRLGIRQCQRLIGRLTLPAE